MSSTCDAEDYPRSSPRRRFVKKSFFFLGSLAAAAATPKSLQASNTPSGANRAAGEPLGQPVGKSDQVPVTPTTQNDYRIFDSHLHCPSDEVGDRVVSDRPLGLWQLYPVTRTFAEFAAYLQRTGVQRGIINSVRSQEAKSPADFIAGNREVARYVERYRGQFLGACVVNPLFIDEALKEIEYCRKQLGFVWVGELCNYVVPYQYSAREFELLVDQVSKLNMILSVHNTFEEMHYIIQNFPKATIVFSQFGDSGGSIFPRIELVAAHPNTYIDTSGEGHDRVGMLEYAVKTIGENRILYGSDFTLNCPATVIGRIQNAFISDEQKQKVLAGNLEALLRRVSSTAS
jgi:predicted TIM-barrel fold metal-dependent hydrolase